MTYAPIHVEAKITQRAHAYLGGKWAPSDQLVYHPTLGASKLLSQSTFLFFSVGCDKRWSKLVQSLCDFGLFGSSRTCARLAYVGGEWPR